MKEAASIASRPRSLRFYRCVSDGCFRHYMTISENSHGECGLGVQLDGIVLPGLDNGYVPLGFEELKRIVKKGSVEIKSEGKLSSYVVIEPDAVTTMLNNFSFKSPQS